MHPLQLQKGSDGSMEQEYSPRHKHAQRPQHLLESSHSLSGIVWLLVLLLLL